MKHILVNLIFYATARLALLSHDILPKVLSRLSVSNLLSTVVACCNIKENAKFYVIIKPLRVGSQRQRILMFYTSFESS